MFHKKSSQNCLYFTIHRTALTDLLTYSYLKLETSLLTFLSVSVNVVCSICKVQSIPCEMLNCSDQGLLSDTMALLT